MIAKTRVSATSKRMMLPARRKIPACAEKGVRRSLLESIGLDSPRGS
jgi:hypothetical protein